MDLSFPVYLRRLLRLVDMLWQVLLRDTTTPNTTGFPLPPPAGPMLPVQLIAIETLVCWPEIA